MKKGFLDLKALTDVYTPACSASLGNILFPLTDKKTPENALNTSAWDSTGQPVIIHQQNSQRNKGKIKSKQRNMLECKMQITS